MSVDSFESMRIGSPIRAVTLVHAFIGHPMRVDTNVSIHH